MNRRTSDSTIRALGNVYKRVSVRAAKGLYGNR